MIRALRHAGIAFVASALAAQDGGRGDGLLARLLAPDTAAVAADEAVELGAAAGPFGVRALADDDPTVRRAGTLLLRCVGPAASDVLPQLVELLEASDGERAVRVLAAMADVASFRPNDALNARMHRRVEALVAAAPDADRADALRRGFVTALVRLRAPMPFAVQIAADLRADYRMTREVAADALLAPPSAWWSSPADRALFRELLEARLAAGPRGAAAAGDRARGQAFGGGVVVEDRFYLKLAALLEADAGEPLAHPAAAARRALFGDRHQRAAGVAELAHHPELAEWTLPTLATALDDPSAAVVGAAATAVGVLGGRAGVAVPTAVRDRLTELAAADERAVAARAAAALRQLPPSDDR